MFDGEQIRDDDCVQGQCGDGAAVQEAESDERADGGAEGRGGGEEHEEQVNGVVDGAPTVELAQRRNKQGRGRFA